MYVGSGAPALAFSRSIRGTLLGCPSDGDRGTQTGVGTHLATLVPSFDPSKDDMQTSQQKVQLLLSAWPKTTISELVTRLILSSSGSAFAKLQLDHAEFMENHENSVNKLIELLGGQ